MLCVLQTCGCHANLALIVCLVFMFLFLVVLPVLIVQHGLSHLEQKEQDDDTPFEEQLEVMDELYRAGKVRALGGGVIGSTLRHRLDGGRPCFV